MLRPVTLIFSLLVGGLIAAFVALNLLSAGQIYEYQDSADGKILIPVDAIVVLAGGRGRLATAGDLWLRYWEHSPTQTPMLYVSGMGHQSTWAAFQSQIRRGLKEVIQSKHVVLETESENTEENARYLLKFIMKKPLEQRWKRVLLVTSSYHMMRAKFIFESVFNEAGIAVAFESYTVVQDPYELSEWRFHLQGIRVTVEEFLKWVYYRYFWKQWV